MSWLENALLLVTPPSVRPLADIFARRDEVSAFGLKMEDFTDLKLAVQGADVLYVTRVQRERFESEELYAAVKDQYIVDADVMAVAPQTMIVMHPLPRVNEIAVDVDKDPRAAYFRQMEVTPRTPSASLALITNTFFALARAPRRAERHVRSHGAALSRAGQVGSLTISGQNPLNKVNPYCCCCC